MLTHGSQKLIQFPGILFSAPQNRELEPSIWKKAWRFTVDRAEVHVRFCSWKAKRAYLTIVFCTTFEDVWYLSAGLPNHTLIPSERTLRNWPIDFQSIWISVWTFHEGENIEDNSNLLISRDIVKVLGAEGELSDYGDIFWSSLENYETFWCWSQK